MNASGEGSPAGFVPDPGLADRMGCVEYAARRKLEQSRFAGFGRSRSNRVAALLGRLGIGLRLAFRLCGLHGRAAREFHDIRVRENAVVLDRWPAAFDGYRLLHLSDLHIDLDPGFSVSLARCLDGLAYDLCVITGDFRNRTLDRSDPSMAAMRDLVPRFHAPVYAVLGNHDSLNMVAPLEAMGVRMLLNESILLGRGDSPFALVGIDDPCIYMTHNLQRAMAGIPSGCARILLSHSPAVYDEAARHGVDLLLAGHTHGGQICLPGGRILLRNDPSPVHMLRGCWRHGAMQGYTSPGTGACGAPLRLFCLPEVTLHQIWTGSAF